jgi:hypothetical protein
MEQFSEKNFSDFVYDTLQELDYEQILTNPSTESVFPCLELHNPLKSTRKTHNGIPISSTFQISITCWNEKQRECMEMINKVDEKLQVYNFVRTNTSPSIKDAILKKYGITITFEVRYNCITNSFEFIK